MKNRLNLDFSLTTNEERTKFINEYLQKNAHLNFTTDELEMMGNYILWGKIPGSNNSIVDNKEIEIETKNKTWTRPIESLDELLESPTFNESQLTTTPTKKVHEVINRSDILKIAPTHLIPVFEDLWAQIDTIDLGINYYELKHNKRKNPPRPQLLKKFSVEEQEAIRLKAESWTQFKYLKNRHLLVELRREQFTIKDSFAPQLQHHQQLTYESAQTLDFDTEIKVKPFGTIDQTNQLLFKAKDNLNPQTYSEEELKIISDIYWARTQSQTSKNQLAFDFEDKDHIFNLIDQLVLLDENHNTDPFNKTEDLIKTLKYYIQFSDLNEIQREILELKIQKKKNHEIALYINKKYNKSYNDNYISTIFRQKVIPNIVEGVKIHKEIIENLYFPEEFKKCSCCGQWLLKNSTNFMRRGRSKDGYSARCKKCDHKVRQQKKEG